MIDEIAASSNAPRPRVFLSMCAPIRYLLIAVVTVTAIAVPLVAVSGSGIAASDGAIEAVTPTRAHRAALATPALREWRTVTVLPTGSLPLAFTIFFVFAGIVGRSLRRIGDIGDDWRSLLEGAPPALR